MFETNPVSLKELLDEVESGEILLPDFQRGWIWDDDRIRGLLASISKGFPVGAVMTLAAGSDIKFKTRPIEGVTLNESRPPDAFLLDGQQRLTTLYQSLRHPCAVNTSDSKRQKVKRWYYVDMTKAMDPNADREDDAIVSVPKNKKETTDFGRKVVRDLSTQEMEFRQHMIPTESLMDPMDWSLGYFEFWKGSLEAHPEGDAVSFFKKFRQEVQDNFQSYQLPVIKLDKNTSKEAVCTVFEKVNTGGVVLNVFELATASFAADADNFSLRDDWEARRERIYSRFGVLRGLEGDQFLQAVALLKTYVARRSATQGGVSSGQLPAIGCKRKDILDLSLDDYQRWAEKLEAGFIEAGKFLRSQYVFGSRNVPYNTQLVPLAALYVELGNELNPAVARERLAHWYWSGVFGEVYGSAVESQFARDMEDVPEFVRSGKAPRLINEASFVPERLMTLRSRQSAAYKGVFALQMKYGAADWQKGEPLELAHFNDEHIDIHHIFPVRWCRDDAKPPVPKRIYDSIVNKTPIDALTNKIIGGSAPSKYLGKLEEAMGGRNKLETVLTSHWVDIANLDKNDFASAFVERGEAMLRLIGGAMGRDLGDGRGVFESALRSVGFSELYIPDEEDFPEEVENEEEGEDDVAE